MPIAFPVCWNISKYTNAKVLQLGAKLIVSVPCAPQPLACHWMFWNALAVLVRELLDQLVVQQGAAKTGTERILVVGNRIAGTGRKLIADWLGGRCRSACSSKALLVGLRSQYAIALVYGNSLFICYR
jgi:hypothetical protein